MVTSWFITFLFLEKYEIKELKYWSFLVVLVSSLLCHPGVPSVVIPAQAGIHCTAGFISGICLCHPVVRFPAFFLLVIPWRGAPAKTNVFVGCWLTTVLSVLLTCHPGA